MGKKANNENIYELTKRGYPQEVATGISVTSSTNSDYIQYEFPEEIRAELERDGVLMSSVLSSEWHPREPNGRIETCEALGPMNEYEFNQYWMEKGKGWIKNNWWTDGLVLQLQKVKTLWQPSLFPSVKTGAPWSFANSPTKIFLARAAVTLASAVVIFGGFLGIAIKLWKRDKLVWLPLIILSVYTLMHTFFAGYTKYRIPLDNFMALYAGSVLIILWDWLRGVRKK